MSSAPLKIAGGAALAMAGSAIPGKAGNALLLAGVGSVALGVFNLTKEGFGGLSQLFENPFAFLGFEQQPPSIEVDPIRPADESLGPFLGRPKNILRVSGVIRSPANGSEFDTGFSNTFHIGAAIENQSNRTVEGRVSLRLGETRDRLFSSSAVLIVNGPSVTLAPAEFRELSIRAPTALNAVGGVVESIRLFFDGHLLDKVEAERRVIA